MGEESIWNPVCNSQEYKRIKTNGFKIKTIDLKITIHDYVSLVQMTSFRSLPENQNHYLCKIKKEKKRKKRTSCANWIIAGSIGS